MHCRIALLSEKKKHGEIEELLDVVDLALLPWSEAREKLTRALNSDNARVRYWELQLVLPLGATLNHYYPDFVSCYRIAILRCKSERSKYLRSLSPVNLKNTL